MSDYSGLNNKRILITGAGTGIGKATALELSRYQCKIAINYHSSDEAAKEVSEKICSELKDGGMRYPFNSSRRF
jgi:NAD(P)-dependent dehydrogenase (short-subunit alcohol dehydrogenase family)